MFPYMKTVDEVPICPHVLQSQKMCVPMFHFFLFVPYSLRAKLRNDVALVTLTLP